VEGKNFDRLLHKAINIMNGWKTRLRTAYRLTILFFFLSRPASHPPSGRDQNAAPSGGWGSFLQTVILLITVIIFLRPRCVHVLLSCHHMPSNIFQYGLDAVGGVPRTERRHISLIDLKGNWLGDSELFPLFVTIPFCMFTLERE
jgi:hypothetical protein